MDNILLSFSPNFFHVIVIFIAVAVIVRLLGNEERKQDYDDEFGDASSLISRWNKGFWIGEGRITREQSFKHTVLIGQSGGGKTSAGLIPTALGMDDCSLIFLDPAKELFKRTAGHLRSKGYRIKVLDLKKPDRSIGFNPLQRATTSTDLNILAEMVVAPQSRQSKDIFWPQMAARLLVVFFKIQKQLPQEFQNLANTRHLANLLQGDPKKMDKLYATFADDTLFGEYKAIISQDDKLLSNVLATVQSSLRIFDDSAVARCTSADTLDLQKFRKEKTALYIWTDIMDASYYSFLLEIWFTQLFRDFMKSIPDKGKLDVFILADEMGSLTIKGFAEALANLRKYRVGIMYAIQSRAQLIERYGRHDADTLLANSWGKLIFPGMETDLAQELEKRLGRWTFEREDGHRGTRELMTISELTHMKEGTAMYTAGANRPMKVTVTPYFKDWSLKSKSEMPLPKISGGIPNELTFIDVDALVRSKKEHV
ncbi:MAG: type IV secretory system conjugative DNA transfer family protein [Flavobacteriales bacterium]|nr:type IV secretory system conjugative DNA transfer family protein [Flavobacteriales bacterium]